LKKRSHPKNQGYYLCVSQWNPTGYLYSKEELLHLKEIGRKETMTYSSSPMRAFTAEIYAMMAQKHFRSAMNLEGIENNVIPARYPVNQDAI